MISGGCYGKRIQLSFVACSLDRRCKTANASNLDGVEIEDFRRNSVVINIMEIVK